MLLWVTNFSHQGRFLLAISPKQCLSPAPKWAIAAALAAHRQLPFRQPGGLSTRPSPACFPLVSASQASPSLVLHSPVQVSGLTSRNTHYSVISTRPSGASPAAWPPPTTDCCISSWLPSLSFTFALTATDLIRYLGICT